MLSIMIGCKVSGGDFSSLPSNPKAQSWIGSETTKLEILFGSSFSAPVT